MSTINSKNVQVGTSNVAAENFTLYQPSTPDGTVRLGVGNSGATTADVASFNSSGVFAFNSGYGSSATAFGCRAWVNFNGTGTVAIRASGNVSSITDNGTGDYTVNYTTALVDANYAIMGSCIGSGSYSGVYSHTSTPVPTSVSSCRFSVGREQPGSFTATDCEFVLMAVFR